MGHGDSPMSDIKLGDLLSVLNNYDVVDLTVPLAENLPAAWPVHMPFQRKVYNWYADRTDQIQPVCPAKVDRFWPVARSHNIAVRSPDPVKTFWLSGLKATALT